MKSVQTEEMLVSKEGRILFVDDEANILSGLRRMLRGMRHTWRMDFANNGMEALDMMHTSEYDVVVSDMRMPIMNGAELLGQIKELYPMTVRIILSGYSDRELALQAVGTAHQFLAKPCDAEELTSTICRALELRRVLRNGALQQVLSKIDSLPCLPRLYDELTAELQTEHPSIQKVSAIIEEDPGMSAKVLQMVNSAFFGLPQKITNVFTATSHLGIEVLQSLVLMIGVFTQFKEIRIGSLSNDSIWEHSISVGRMSQSLSKQLGFPADLQKECFTAGLLHDIGRLVLAAKLPTAYQEVFDHATEHQISLTDAEIEVFGASHAQVGAYLLGLWKLPDATIEAVGYYHQPSVAVRAEKSPLLTVHLANAFFHSIRDLKRPELRSLYTTSIDMDYCLESGLSEADISVLRGCCETVLLRE